MIKVNLSEETLLEAIMDRVEFWTSETDALDLYEEYYRGLIESGCFDDTTLDIDDLVDNDYVNYTQVISREDFENYNIEYEYDDKILVANKDNYLIQTY